MAISLEKRKDLQLIAEIVSEGARVLDVGCAEGSLLKHLRDIKQVDGRGLELDMEKVASAMALGVPVVQGDANTDLSFYPNQIFDYVIMVEAMQAMRRPQEVLLEMLRIGKKVIVAIPNLGHWRVRWQMLIHGRYPRTGAFDYAWHSTPNVHPCSIKDFIELCNDLDIRIQQMHSMSHDGRSIAQHRSHDFTNLFAERGIFVLSKQQ